MYLIVISLMYISVLMAVAEASSPSGSLLGAAITFVLYGLLPCALLVYILGTPTRKRRLRQQRALEQQAWEQEQQAQQARQAQTPPPAEAEAASHAPDSHGHAPGTAEVGSITPVREKP